MSLSRYFSAVNALVLILMAGLLVFGNMAIFNIAYFAVFVFVVARTLSTSAKKRQRIYLIIAYFAVMNIQIIFCAQIVFVKNAPFLEQPFRRLFGVALLLLPLAVSRYLSIGKYSRFYLPSLQEAATISFSELKNGAKSISDAVDTVTKAGKSLSPENLKTIVEDLPRHDSFRYINNDSLSPEFFELASKSLDDPYVYIVISSTGSAASEMISVFTQKQYNHASLSFDRELKTIVSYNGGERAYPPGLNSEMLEFFCKKPDASIIVYRLPCSMEQKQIILDKVDEINREGSAYNMMGLVLKYSHKPNIMFCSQFVYKMLEIAGLCYFSKMDGKVTPTDLVELDYRRKLEYAYELNFSPPIENPAPGSVLTKSL